MKSAVLGIFFAIGLALAGSGILVAKDGGACREDVKKFCSGAQDGKGGMWKCLQDNQNKLSSECQAKLEKKRQGMQACQADRDKFCKGMERGKGLKECMKSHEAELSGECREHIQKKRQHHGKWAACKADKARFCGNVQPGEGKIRACLADHKKDLAPECRAALP